MTINQELKILRETKKENLVQLIFEQRRKCCENCKHWCQEFQSIGMCDKGIKEEPQFKQPLTYATFGCNKWEK